ncbi:hypothetical protein MMC08_008538 [Hypocenomyce scalaris]|nr:hypothetical protein [Hypocenomyce scalaris]
MPSTRITIASNSKQSQRAPFLIPSSTSLDPSSANSCRALVVKTAQSKLRIKKASRVFAAGTGQELLEESDWKSVLRDDVVLLVSAGEDYVGARKEETPVNDTQEGNVPSPQGNPDCPVNILAHNAYVDPLSITQIETTARTLPGIIHAVGQPDLHPGTKFPIGAVFVSEGWIHPPLIGGDIGCGMAWYKTTLSRNQVDGDKGRKIAEKLRGLEGAWRTQSDREAWLRDNDGPDQVSNSSSAGEAWDASLGTIGAGNHFAELQIIEEANLDEIEGLDDQHTLHADDVVLLVHSGSRGYGADILKRYTADGRTSMYETEAIATAYLAKHARACDWARKNRDLIALRFLACLEPGNEAWDLGISDTEAGAVSPAKTVAQARREVQARKVVDIWHNNIERAMWPPSPPPPSASSISPPTTSDTATAPTTPPPPLPLQYPVYIHRKGAAPTLHPLTHLPLPLLPLPGSRATPTLLLHPLHPPATAHGASNALSLAHGAGRSMSRARAGAYVARKYAGRAEDLLRGDYAPVDWKGNKGGVGGGGGKGAWVVCEEKALVWEEAGEAYKDVWAVGGDLVGRGVARRVGWGRGVVVYKVRVE